MVMGGDSCSEVLGFKSRHSILDGHFLLVFVVKIDVCLQRPKINNKRGRGWPIFKNQLMMICIK